MRAAARPIDELARMADLRRYNLLDTSTDQTVDDLTSLAAHVCAVPVALVTLIDDERVWVKAPVGSTPVEAERDTAFCAHAALQSGTFVVPDARTDVRFADNPHVAGEPHIRFYAGSPLITPSGHVLGTLCVIDHVPRELTAAQLNALEVIGRQVMAQFELRRQTQELIESEARLRMVTENACVGLVMLTPDRRYAYANGTYAEILGLSSPAIIGEHASEVLPLIYEDQVRQQLDRAFAGERVVYERHSPTPNGDRYYLVRYEPTIVGGAVAIVVVVITEITERKEAEAAVRRAGELSAVAEHEFRKLFAANPMSMWIYDRTTLRFLEVNDAAISHYGYAREEFLAMTIADIRPPEDVGRLLESVKEARPSWLGTGHWQHQLKSGRIIDVEISSHVLTFAGRPAALVVAQDITERRLAAEAQRASEEQYRKLFEASPDGLVIADRDSNYLDGNPSICRMLGYQKSELVGLNARDILTTAEAPQIELALRALRISSDYHQELRFKRKDGSVFTAEVTATSLPDGNFLGIIRDVSERHDALVALGIAEARTRYTLESANVGIWDMNYVTGKLQWSETLEAQYGLKPGTFPGTFEAFVALIHPEDRESMLALVSDAIRKGGDFTVLNRCIWPDGSVRWLHGMGRVTVGEDGLPTRAVGVSMDITERRTLEQQYQQAQKMEAIGRLAGGIAHDFNNLLTAILGYCELLLADLGADHAHRADLLEIQTAGNRAAGLTRQLLAFSRREIIEPTLLDLNVIVTDMISMLRRLIGEDITVAIKLLPTLGLVKADRGQVEQIVMNLAVNARDAMPNGGVLTIATSHIEIDEHYQKSHLDADPGEYIALTISDTGTGMTPEVRARLFEPFFTTKPVGKGTGLGLATVHGVVKRSGGSVNVYSEVGKGTSVKVYFPMAESTGSVAEITAAPRTHTGAETVLVVEDEAGLRELVRKLLTRQGYTVHVAANAEEAQHIVGQVNIDVLLTDVVMPGASGPELTKRLLEQQPDLKVVFMSGYTEDAIVHHGVLEPGIAFLHKPFTSATLARKLRDVLDQKRLR